MDILKVDHAACKELYQYDVGSKNKYIYSNISARALSIDDLGYNSIYTAYTCSKQVSLCSPITITFIDLGSGAIRERDGNLTTGQRR